MSHEVLPLRITRILFSQDGLLSCCTTSYQVYVKRVTLNSTAVLCLDVYDFPLFLWEKKRQVRPETPQRCGRLISWLNITRGKKVFVFFSHSDWSTRSTLRSTAAGHSSFFSSSLVSRERSKSHFPLSQTVHFFLKRDFWACESLPAFSFLKSNFVTGYYATPH